MIEPIKNIDETYSVGKKKGFFGDFKYCSIDNYSKSMKETYDSFVRYINKIKTKECDYLIDGGIPCSVEFPRNNEKDKIICGVPLEGVKKTLGEEIQEEKGDDEYYI